MRRKRRKFPALTVFYSLLLFNLFDAALIRQSPPSSSRKRRGAIDVAPLVGCRTRETLRGESLSRYFEQLANIKNCRNNRRPIQLPPWESSLISFLRIGNMHFGQLKTLGRYFNSECTSVLQKCIRIGMEGQALFWDTELDSSGLGEYLWKRLRIMRAKTSVSMTVCKANMLCGLPGTGLGFSFKKHSNVPASQLTSWRDRILI